VALESMLLRSLAFHAGRDPDRECIVDLRPGEPVRRYSYAEIDDAIARLAGGLTAAGLGRGDRVVLRLQNTSDFIVSLYACLRAGAIAVPTIYQYAGDELRHAVQDCRASCLIFDDSDLEVVAQALTGEILPVAAGHASGPGILSFAELATASPAPAVPVAETDDALIFYTSGTTSRPKGVVLSHGAIASASLGNAELWRLRPDDRSYVVLPLFHCNALFMQLIPALLSGATAILAERYSASGYLDEVRAHGITLANLTGGAIRSLLAQPESPRDCEHPLRQLTFGLPLHAEEIEHIAARFGIPAYMCYGLTESSSGGTRSPVHVDPRGGWQSLGFAQPGWEVAIAAESGPPGPGELGEILLRGPGLMSRYWELEEMTAATLVDGWLHTGDLGTIDADGYIFFHSREKDMLKPKGENVAASEIERALEQHDAVLEAGVVGVFDPHDEERIVAMVVGDEVGSDELREHCSQRLAPFKVPKEFIWVPELPKTSIGKINKGAIKAMLEER
jgi:crotonobetaine/carnitine-CoA ligase